MTSPRTTATITEPVYDIDNDATFVELIEQFGCECELDWNCGLHQGGPTAIERINDAWASEQTEIDRRNGQY